MNPDGSNPINLTNTGPYNEAVEAWSPDMTKIAYHSNEPDGDFDIWFVDRITGNRTNLTNNSNITDADPAWSPDGSEIAFNRQFTDANSNFINEIYMMNADGSNIRRLTFGLTNVQALSWSPDGSEIAFSANQDIYVMHADGSNIRQLTSNPALDYVPEWSPDGRRITFESDRNGSWDLYVIHADGTNEARMTCDPNAETAQSWERRKLNLGEVAITLLSPQGGETWTGLTSQPITWASQGNIDHIKLEYSIDCGQTYSNLIDPAPNNGQFIWTVPNILTSDARIKITAMNAAHVPLAEDVCDGNFTIIPGQAQSIVINDVTVTEGNSGTVNAVFTVTLSAASSQQITVDYATANGTAEAGSDYVTIPTTQLIIPANTPSQTITVEVNGDLLDEVDETFFVNLSNPSNAVIADNQGQGTITDDDLPPSLSINDVMVTEGNTGTVNAVFTVSLSATSGKQVTVDYSTADGTATADADYQFIPTTQLIFSPNTTTQTITVVVNGDLFDESDETFFVNLTNPANATIADAQGMCTITDDDVPLVIIVLNPTHDAYVRSDQPTTNFGTATTLRMKQSSPIYNSYLKFVVSSISGPVQSAKLRMKVTVASSSGGSVYSVSNNRTGTSQPWTQSNLNYNNAPTISGTALSTIGAVTGGQMVEFDVTAAIAGNGTFSFGLKNSSSTAVQYSSKEGATKPELVIQFVPQPPAITSFSPSSGAVGTQVIITGNNFIGAAQVAFNGVAAGVFTVNSSTQITATVPTGATTGKITVTTPGGTATSNTDFIVTPPPIVLNPTDDAYVKSDQATTNFGTATTLRMRQAAIILNSYLKFVVSGISGPVSSAKLRMKVTTASSSGGSVYSVSNNYLGTSTPWIENGLNYNNAPAISGTPWSTVGSVTVGQVVEFDVTPAIAGNGTFSFGLKNSSTTAVQYSSEEGATKPELVIQFGAGTAAKIADLKADAVALENVEAALPKKFTLSANYPNPFNAQTVIEYALPEAVNVRLVIFNVLGQRIRQLVDENQSAGYKRVIWNGKNEFGSDVGSGIYFLQLDVGRQKFVRKMFLQR